MIKKQKGITLVSLIITVGLMLVLTSTSVYMSLDRFDINNLRKMYNDIELLQDKVSNYYLKYGVLPILRDSENNPIPYTSLNFIENANEGENYYIIDLEAMYGITLNYGKAGYENPNNSNDVYLINEKTHKIYYAKGMILKEKTYYTLNSSDTGITADNIPPSSPEIRVLSGIKEIDAEGKEYYTSNVEIEIISGKDNWSGVARTIYSGGSSSGEISGNGSKVITLSTNGTHIITAQTFDNATPANNSLESKLTITISK